MPSRRMLTRIAAASALSGALALPGCFRAEDSLAGGTETETSLTGRILDSAGRPVAGVPVSLFARDYDPVDGKPAPAAQRKTDDSGRYLFARVPAGLYNVEARAAGGLAALVQDVEAADPAYGNSRATLVPAAPLLPACRILIPWERLPARTGWVYLPGTDVAAAIGELNGTPQGLLIKDVPAGAYTVLDARAEGAAQTSNLLQEILTVHPGESAIVPPYAAWAHSLRVRINTAAAGVAANVANFPLLVRLDSSVFDFSQARPDGADARFSKPDGTPLPYQIERWDAAARRAEFWVRMDTVYGNRSDQYLVLHFGNDSAAGRSDGPTVFSPVAGFAGVWHLGEDSAGATANGLYRDATGLGNDGDDRIAAGGREGIIGAGHAFDGAGDHVDLTRSSLFIGSAGQPFALSAWFRPDAAVDWSPSTMDSRLMDIHRSDTNGSSIGLGYGKGGKVYFYNHHEPRFHFSTTQVAPGLWHLASVAYDGKTFHLYVDGMEASAPVAAGLLAGGNYRAKLGKYGDTPVCAFAGSIDEARISRVSRSAAWMRLEFETQKPDQTAVVLSP